MVGAGRGERRGAVECVGLVVLLTGCPAAPMTSGTEAGEESSSSTGGGQVTSTTGDPVMTSTSAETGESSSSSGGDLPPGCDDAIKNQNESDLDCGGPCPACPEGQACGDNSDCETKACAAGTCVAPKCLADGDCAALDGLCVRGACEDFACVVANGDEGEPCDDNDLCSLSSTCQAGACTAAEAIDCTGLDSPCTQGQCDPGSGACLLEDLADGSKCDDGDACTALEACKAGSCVTAEPGAVFFEDFSAPAPGWEYDMLWEVGPAVASPAGVGGADPATDHSATDDDMIAGTMIGGLDNAPGHARLCMSSPAIDTSKLAAKLWVNFWRHLHAPATPAVVHSVEVWNGSLWKTLETGYPGVSDDADWTFVKFDATGNANKGFRVRICVERVGNSPDFAGWSVDDLSFAGTACTP